MTRDEWQKQASKIAEIAGDEAEKAGEAVVKRAEKAAERAIKAAENAEKANTLAEANLAVERAKTAVKTAREQIIFTGMDIEKRDEVNDAVSGAKEALTRATEAQNKLLNKVQEDDIISYMSQFFIANWEGAKTATETTINVDTVSVPKKINELTLQNLREPKTQLKFFFINLLYWLNINNKPIIWLKIPTGIIEFINKIKFDNDKKNNLIIKINNQITNQKTETKYLKYKTKYLNLKRQM
jgi:hypothetical protein